MRVHTSNRGQLDRGQRVFAQSIRSFLLLLHGFQLADQQMQLRDRRARGLQDYIHLEPIVLAAEQRFFVLVPSHVLHVSHAPRPHDVRQVLRARRLRHQVVVQHQAIRVRSLRSHTSRNLRRKLVVGRRGPFAGVDLLPR